jgi:predicted phosphodiesterase
MMSNFSPKLLHAADIDSDSLIMENSNNLQTAKYDYPDINQSHDFNFVAVGDWSCNKEAQKTAVNILKIDPEILLGLGDYSYEKNAQCWKGVTEGIDPKKIKISFGNHEFEDRALLKQYMDYTNLEKQYYSFDYNNVHFISMSTEAPYEIGSEQYEFIKSDLEKTSKDQNVNWIIVYYHQPMYTSKTNHEGLESLRDIYHTLFTDYGVDLVLQGHVHNYQRTYPLIYNNENPSNPTIVQSAVLDNGNEVKTEDRYVDSPGTIFAIVGTGGRELHELDDQSYFTIQQLEEYGFLELKVTNDGKNLVGKFYANDGLIKDDFIIEKSVDKNLDNKKISNNGTPNLNAIYYSEKM